MQSDFEANEYGDNTLKEKLGMLDNKKKNIESVEAIYCVLSLCTKRI